MWKAYNQLGNMGDIDPVTGATANHVKVMWQRAKNTFKTQQVHSTNTHKTQIGG